MTEYWETTYASLDDRNISDLYYDQTHSTSFYLDPYSTNNYRSERFISLPRCHPISDASEDVIETGLNMYPHPPGSGRAIENDQWNSQHNSTRRLIDNPANPTNIYVTADNGSPVHIYASGSRPEEAYPSQNVFDDEEANLPRYRYDETIDPHVSYANTDYAFDPADHVNKNELVKSCFKEESDRSNFGTSKHVTFNNVSPPDFKRPSDELRPPSVKLNRVFTTYRNSFDSSYQNHEV